MRLHFEHSAIFLSLPPSYKVFITISPPQSGQMNFCVATVVREFLLAPAMGFLHKKIIRIAEYIIENCVVSQLLVILNFFLSIDQIKAIY